MVTRLEEETRIGKGGTLAGQFSRLDLVVLDELGSAVRALKRQPTAADPAGAHALHERRHLGMGQCSEMAGLPGLPWQALGNGTHWLFAGPEAIGIGPIEHRADALADAPVGLRDVQLDFRSAFAIPIPGRRSVATIALDRANWATVWLILTLLFPSPRRSSEPVRTGSSLRRRRSWEEHERGIPLR